MEGTNTVDSMNASRPGFIEMLGGEITAIDTDEKTCTFEFTVSTQFCHSIDVVQGGFITAMLDAAMSHAVFATVQGISGVSSLEIKTSYLEPTRAGTLRVVGQVVKDSYKTVFLEGKMYNAEGLLSATASSVAKLVRAS
ncbi:PaaI family thioesterase [Candidatus Marimicrobium litorale]|uniref:PaaI family thioesterase n=1 Tax=Candidatus Marimicrobium litorale TaxID=2518991 RepID=A0ABT3T8U5_9GAMM|nr:PaaI family thioesterase [Candidatus Marimicrobium litorale]MCX2977894.1 PaaI family thioesterase [Candidatus Marimicrobium litorale]